MAKLRGAPELTAVNTIVGTVPYMAPEQLMGGVLDARVDQYALAVIAYEMLAGEMAFDGSGAVADVARRVLTHVPPFLAGVPQAVNEVLFRGMARAADDRFPSVREFFTALEQAAAVKEPSLPEPKIDDELPPLAGDATRVTVAVDAATRAAAAAADADDPPAPPPEDAAPTKEPQTPTITSPDAGARRRDLRDAGGGSAERERRQRPHAGAAGAAVAVDARGAEAVGRADADAEDASAAVPAGACAPRSRA